jgi:hypothetical protein
MPALLLFLIIFVYSAVLWVVILFLYSTFVESFDFGILSKFAWKSAILVGIVAAMEAFIPHGSWFTPFVWGAGLVILFRRDAWETLILVVMIWVANFLVGLIIRLLLLRLWEPYEL